MPKIDLEPGDRTKTVLENEDCDTKRDLISGRESEEVKRQIEDHNAMSATTSTRQKRRPLRLLKILPEFNITELETLNAEDKSRAVLV